MSPARISFATLIPGSDALVIFALVPTREAKGFVQLKGTTLQNCADYGFVDFEGVADYNSYVLSFIEDQKGLNGEFTQLVFLPATLPTVASQADYNYEIIDGVDDPWPRLKQTFYILRSAYTKGMAVTAPPAASGTGWVKISEKESRTQDDRMHAFIVVLEVEYSTTGESRTDYKFNPETGTLITTVTTWVANTAGVPSTPSQSSGVNVTQKQMSYLWSLRTTETNASVTGYKLAVPSVSNVVVPDQLISVDVEWSEADGEGEGETDWAGEASGTSYSLSSTTSANAESSAAVMPELVVVTKQTWGHNIPTTLYYMIIEKVDGAVTLSMIQSQLSSLYGITAASWPVFKPQTYVCALSGGKVSISAEVRANASISYSSSSLSWSRTNSKSKKVDHSLTAGSRVIPNVLCSGISLNDTRTKTVNATAALGFNSGIIPSFTFQDPTTTDTCAGSAKGSFSSTDPPSVPTSGKYILNVATRPFQNLAGFMMVNVEVLDAVNLS